MNDTPNTFEHRKSDRRIDGRPETSAITSGLIMSAATLEAERDSLLIALRLCVEVAHNLFSEIETYKNTWDKFYQTSVEMKPIRETLEKYPQPAPGRDEHQLQIIAPKEPM